MCSMKRLTIWTDDDHDQWYFEVKGRFTLEELEDVVLTFVVNMGKILQDLGQDNVVKTWKLNEVDQ